jgi:hypothetical protein
MKTKSWIKSTGLCVSFLILGSQCAIDRAEAAPDTFGTQVFETRDFASNADGVFSRKVGIYGEVLFASGGRVRIRDRVDVRQQVEADIRLIPPEDKQRLSAECSRSPCLQIITGFVVRSTLRATDVHWLGNRAWRSLVGQRRNTPSRGVAPLQLTASLPGQSPSASTGRR